MRGQRKNPRKAVQPFENKKRKIDIFKNYEANGVEKIQRKLEIFSTLISKKSKEGSQVAEKGKEKQYDADGKQGVVMTASERRLCHFSNNRSRHGSDRIKQAFGNECGSACYHQYHHSLPDDTA